MKPILSKGLANLRNQRTIFLLLGCPNNYIYRNDHCYGFFVNKTQKLKYADAKEKCKKFVRYDLASVFSREETKYLGNMTVKINPAIGKKSFNFPWIGLHKDAYAPNGILINE